MALKAKSICKYTGCNNLLDKSGYCTEHIQYNSNKMSWSNVVRDRETRKIEQTVRWREISKRHRRNYPLCVPCKDRGVITPAQLVHHEPPIPVLLARGLSPYDSKYHVSSCIPCHNKHINKDKPNKKYTDIDMFIGKNG